MQGSEEAAPSAENGLRSVQAQPSGQPSAVASPRSPQEHEEDEDEVVETDYAGGLHGAGVNGAGGGWCLQPPTRRMGTERWVSVRHCLPAGWMPGD